MTDPRKSWPVRKLAQIVVPPLSILANAGDACIGAGAAILSVAGLGLFKGMNSVAVTHLKTSGTLLANLPASWPITLLGGGFNHKSVPYLFKLNRVDEKINEIANGFRDNESKNPVASIIQSQLISRVGYLGAGLTAIATRVADVGTAALSLPLAAICLGQWTKANTYLLQSLSRIGQLPAVVYYYGIKTINPWAFPAQNLQAGLLAGTARGGSVFAGAMNLTPRYF